MAGPWTGQIMADLGADVIKVERPVVGDDTRAWGPPFPGSREIPREAAIIFSQSRQAVDHPRSR
jgi:crotonobetainyl-CoA:carnitine CoA-transferase CaiB-like acyl-CoA transferase